MGVKHFMNDACACGHHIDEHLANEPELPPNGVGCMECTCPLPHDIGSQGECLDCSRQYILWLVECLNCVASYQQRSEIAPISCRECGGRVDCVDCATLTQFAR